MRIAGAALLYFASVYAIAFPLGAIRVIWLEPRLGPVVATACEAPLLLAAMVVVARRVVQAVDLPRRPVPLLLMGVGGLVLQQIADFVLGTVLRGISPSEQLAHFATLEGLIYAALLVVYVILPFLLHRKRAPAPEL